MQAESRRIRARLAALERHRPAADPAIADARRDLATERLAEHITRTVAELPPLTPEQRDRLAGLLYGQCNLMDQTHTIPSRP